MLALREAETLPALRDALALVAHLPMPSLPPPVAIEVTAARERMWALEGTSSAPPMPPMPASAMMSEADVLAKAAAAKAAPAAAAKAARGIAQPKLTPSSGAADGAGPMATAAAAAKGAVSQWASSLLGFSSQFSAGDNSAMQVLGENRVTKGKAAGGSSVKAWSAVPRPGETKEWVRLGFKTAVVATEVHVFESFTPGSVSAIRLADSTEAPFVWVDVYTRADGDGEGADVGTHRCFAPTLDGAAAGLVARAVEVELDTSAWGEDHWSEIEAVRLVGAPPPPLKEGALGAFMPKQPWEGERHYAARTLAAQRAVPPTADEDEDVQMRRAALSMVWQNVRLLGARYPPAVEAEAGCRKSGGADAASGYAVQSAIEAEQALGMD